MTSILNLNLNIISHISSNLTVYDILSLFSTCKKLRSYNKESYWRTMCVKRFDELFGHHYSKLTFVDSTDYDTKVPLNVICNNKQWPGIYSSLHLDKLFETLVLDGIFHMSWPKLAAMIYTPYDNGSGDYQVGYIIENDSFGINTYINNQKNGFGLQIRIYENGVDASFGYTHYYVYIGNFNENYLDGYGVLIEKNGSLYVGNFYNGNKYGYGHYIFGHGNWYIGNWTYNRYDGFGTLCIKDRIIYIGEWHGNNMHGYGTYYYDDGSIYKGTWYRNNKNGFGKLIHPDRADITGYFYHDRYIRSNY